MPTLKAIFWNPTLLFQPRELSRIFMANLWVLFGPGTDNASKTVKEGLITPNAYGIVLDIGAGWWYLLTLHQRDTDILTENTQGMDIASCISAGHEYRVT
jgi:hypothetical protein